MSLDKGEVAIKGETRRSARINTRVARNSANTVIVKRLRMFVLNFAPLLPSPDPNSPDKDTRTLFETYLDGMTVEPLKGAYVVFVPTPESQDPRLHPNDIRNKDASKAFYCRTNHVGELIRISKSEIDDTSAQPSQPRLFNEGECFLYYWTFSKEDFKKVIANLSRAIDNYEFSSFQVVPQPNEPEAYPLELLTQPDEDYPSINWGMLKQTLFTKTSTTSFSGYYGAWRMHGATPGGTQRVRKDIDPNALYMFAGSNVINALYIAEILYLRAFSFRQKTIEDFGIFEQVKAICKMADDKRRIPSIDEANKVNRGEYREKFYDYAYDCARDTRVTRDLFEDAVYIAGPYPIADRVEDNPGVQSAKKINRLGIWHPVSPEGDFNDWFEYRTVWRVGIDPKPERALVDPSPIMHYFDFYRFGAVQPEKEWYNRVDQTGKKITGKMTEIGNMLKQLMEANLPYADFVCHLDSHCDLELEKRKQLHIRYLDMALNVAYPWWEKFDVESEWERLQPHMGWIAESSDKLGVLFREHFGDLDNIQKYNNMLEEAAGVFNMGNFESSLAMMRDHLVAYNTKLGGKTAERQLRVSFSTWDPESGMNILTVRIEDEEVTILRALVNVSEGTRTVEELVHPLDTARIEKIRLVPTGRGTVKVYKEVTKPIKVYHVKPIPNKFTEWPDWMGAFGDSIALVLSIVNLCNDIKNQEKAQGKIEVVAKVAMNTFQAMDSGSAALNATRLYRQKKWAGVSRFAEIGQKVKGPGLLLEAVFNVKEGAPLLVMTEGSPTATAYGEGDLLEFSLQEAKGLVLVASVTPGAVAAGGALLGGGTVATAFGVAIPPLGIGLAIGGILVVLIDIAIYLHKGPATIMQQIEQDLDKAIGREFGLFDKERTYDSIDQFAKDAKELLSSWGVQA